MNISSGISEINMASMNRANSIPKKTYVWPVYQESRVEKVKSAKEQFGEPVFVKPSESVKHELLKKVASSENSYTSRGSIATSAPIIERGSFFSALA